MPRPFSWAEIDQPEEPTQASTSDSITMVSRSQDHEPERLSSRSPSFPRPYYHYRHMHRHLRSQDSQDYSSSHQARDPQSFYDPHIFQTQQRPKPAQIFNPHTFQRQTQTFHDVPLDDDEDHGRPPRSRIWQPTGGIAPSTRDAAPRGPRYPHPYLDASTSAPRRESLDAITNGLGPDSSRSDLDLTSHGAMPPDPTTGAATAATARATPDTEGLTPNQKPPGGDPSENYKPKSVRFWLVLLSNFIAIFLVALDRTIIATAVPRISDDFRSLGDIGWYGSAYMLTSAASQLLFGRVYKFYDVKWTYMTCIIVFEVGSVICAAAPTSAVFIAGRAIAGFGSAGIFSGSMMVMIPMIPLPKRPVFQAIFGMVFGFASVIGPLLGGVFTGSLSWRWCFWINLPVGGVALLCLIFFLHPPRRKPGAPVPLKEQFLRLDPLGTLFFLPSIVALLLALQWGGASYAWNDARVVALFLVFAVMFAGFAAVQVLMPGTATVPARIIKQRSMLAGTVYTIFLSGAMILAIYYVPLWFQTVLVVSPLKSGLYTFPLVLSIVVSSVISGAATQKLGYYVPSMLLCPAIMAIGEGLLSTLTPTTPSSRWIAYQFLTGFGLGFGLQTVNLAVQTVFRPEDVSTGIAISFFSQQLGAAIFVSVGQSILNNLLVGRLADANIPGFGRGSGHVVTEAGATDLLGSVDERFRPTVVEAYNFACTRVFLTGTGLAVATFVAAGCMEWRSIKKAQPGGPGRGSSEGAHAEKRGRQEAGE